MKTKLLALSFAFFLSACGKDCVLPAHSHQCACKCQHVEEQNDCHHCVCKECGHKSPEECKAAGCKCCKHDVCPGPDYV